MKTCSMYCLFTAPNLFDTIQCVQGAYLLLNNAWTCPFPVIVSWYSIDTWFVFYMRSLRHKSSSQFNTGLLMCSGSGWSTDNKDSTISPPLHFRALPSLLSKQYMYLCTAQIVKGKDKVYDAHPYSVSLSGWTVVDRKAEVS